MMLSLRPVAARSFAVALIAALALALGPPAALAQTAAAKERVLALRYGVFLGDIYAFGFDVTLGVDRTGYAVAADGGTRGNLAQLFAWRTQVLSEGKLGALAPPAGFAPARFDVMSEWRGNPRRTTLRFLGRGRYAVEHDPAEPPRSDPAPAPVSLPADVLDPAAAAIAALSASARDGACARRIAVFDGKRRYDLIIRNGDGAISLAPDKHAAYAGPALSCRIGIQRISGFGNVRTPQSWDDGSVDPPTIEAARLAPGMPLVPVRIAATVSLGPVVAHLIHAELREHGATRTLAELAEPVPTP
jgi:Protein of unknown function (DUF3108)